MAYCERCGDELSGGSHWHCGNCTSTQETSMYGHYFSDFERRNGKMVRVSEPYFHCKPEDVIKREAEA